MNIVSIQRVAYQSTNAQAGWSGWYMRDEKYKKSSYDFSIPNASKSNAQKEPAHAN